MIDGIDTGVENVLTNTGCTILDLIRGLGRGRDRSDSSELSRC